jgi:putative endonuclease
MGGVEKRIVYILRSGSDPPHYYVGITSDINGRLQWHNCGLSGYGLHHRPWSLVVSMEFPTEGAAVRFKQYLKSGSGRAFTTRHFPGNAGD